MPLSFYIQHVLQDFSIKSEKKKKKAKPWITINPRELYVPLEQHTDQHIDI